MLHPQLVLLRLPTIDRPACPQCGSKMMLAGIEPVAPGIDHHSFECDSCDHSETTTVELG